MLQNLRIHCSNLTPARRTEWRECLNLGKDFFIKPTTFVLVTGKNGMKQVDFTDEQILEYNPEFFQDLETWERNQDTI